MVLVRRGGGASYRLYNRKPVVAGRKHTTLVVISVSLIQKPILAAFFTFTKIKQTMQTCCNLIKVLSN